MSEQMVITSLTIAVAVALLTMASNVQKSGFLSYVTGNYLAPQNSKVKFEWTDPAVVGNTMSFEVKVSIDRRFESIDNLTTN